MAARFKSTIGLIILIVIGIIGIFYFLVPSAEEDIHMLAERVLQETIIEDYHVRSNTEPIYSRPGGRKIKNYQIETEKGVETFSFKDSIDEYRANQLVTQYLLAEYSPINPDTFMAVFNEKMKKNGITDSMGIIYRYKGQTQYSNNDSLSPRTAYCTTIQFLDARETVSVQAWVNYNIWTIIKYIPLLIIFYVVCVLGLGALLILIYTYYKNKKFNAKDNFIAAEVKASESEGEAAEGNIRLEDIILDTNKTKAYMGSKELDISKQAFQLLLLFQKGTEHFVSRDEIKKGLWTNEYETLGEMNLNRRVDSSINRLRKVLQDYPQYKIKRIRGAGYQLVVNSNLCKNGSVGQVDHYKIIVEKILNRLRNCFKCL